MTEFKTLKDLARIEHSDIDCKHTEFNEDTASFMECSDCLRENLKQEAIKWVKEILMFEKPYSDYKWERITGNKIEYSEEGRMGMVNFIKYFFNLTKEDLK